MNVGAPCTEDGEDFGLHGRISNTPGENISSGIEWDNDKPVIKVKGRMREARLFGENVILERENHMDTFHEAVRFILFILFR